MKNENEVIAILMEKVNLSDQKFLFRPIEVITGEIEEEHGILVTNHNTEYLSMECSYLAFSELKECYGFEITMEELINKYDYNDKKDAKEALKEYFYEISTSIHIGTYKDESDSIEITDIPYDDLEDYEVFSEEELDQGLSIELYKEDIDAILDEKNINKIHNKFTRFKEILETLENAENDNNITERAKIEVPNERALEVMIVPEVKMPKIEVAKPQIDVADLYEKVTNNVKSQDDQVEDIITTIAMNYMSKNRRDKSHILITGPTGTGKTEIMECISQYINVPMAKYDMSQISVTGYVGKNIDDILIRLFFTADQDLERAEHGILALDEIDKKASDSNGDVSGRGVLNSLLKVLDGTTFDLEVERGRRVPFDTSNLTVVAMGAFATMKKCKQNQLGFAACNTVEEESAFHIEDFVKYGMPEEFMGRFTTLVTLNALSIDDLKDILLTSKISPLIMKSELLKEFGINLQYTDAYIEAVARRAIALKTGARSLKSTVDYSLKKAEYEILKNRIYKELVLDSETVTNNKVFVLK